MRRGTRPDARSGTRLSTQDVEIVEAAAEGDGLGASGPDAGGQDTGGQDAGGPAPASGARYSRSRWWWVATGTVLLLVAVPALVRAVLEHQRLAALAQVPGIVAPLDGPVHELWSTPRSPSRDAHDVGGVLVGSWWDPARGTAARGVDSRTGTDVWSIDLTGPHSSGTSCAFADGQVAGARQAVLTCMVVDESSEVPTGGVGWTTPTKVHLAALDPRTGQVVATLPAAPDDVLAGLGADVVIGSVVDGLAQVRRVDPRTGETVWTSHLARASGGVAPSTVASIQVSGDSIVLDAGSQVGEVAASGEVLHEWDGLLVGSGRSVEGTQGGDVLRSVYSAAGGAVVTDLRRGTSVTIPQLDSIRPLVDDGSATGLLISAGAHLTAWDLASGGERWRANEVVESVVVLGGTVYSVGAGAVRAQDAMTGATRWTVPSGITRDSSLATDGLSLLLLGLDSTSGHAVLRAVDVSDGSQIWTAQVRESASALFGTGGRLYAGTDDGGVMAFG